MKSKSSDLLKVLVYAELVFGLVLVLLLFTSEAAAVTGALLKDWRFLLVLMLTFFLPLYFYLRYASLLRSSRAHHYFFINIFPLYYSASQIIRYLLVVCAGFILSIEHHPFSLQFVSFLMKALLYGAIFFALCSFLSRRVIAEWLQNYFRGHKDQLRKKNHAIKLTVSFITGIFIPLFLIFLDTSLHAYFFHAAIFHYISGLVLFLFFMFIFFLSVFVSYHKIYRYLSDFLQDRKNTPAINPANPGEEIIFLLEESRDRYATMVTKMHHYADSLYSFVTKFAGISKEMEARAGGQSGHVGMMVSSLDQSDDLSRNIDTKISEVAKIAMQTKQIVNDGFDIIEKNRTQMQKIRSTNHDTIQGIKHLGSQIESIREIMNIINSIADQTKIIAFNAQLEASAAGEAGQNFAIVAREIRRLADSTVSSTKEIKARIHEIQRASDSLILASEEGTERIREGWELSSELQSVFRMIQNSSDISAGSAGSIIDTIKKQIEHTAEMQSALHEVSNKIQLFVQDLSTSTRHSDDLLVIVKELKYMTEEYRP